MKKYTVVLSLLAVLPFVSANAYEYETTQTRNYYTSNRTSPNRKSSGYHNTITNNFYYVQPDQDNGYKSSSRYVSSGTKYSNVDTVNRYDENYERKSTVVKRTETETRSTKLRKYFLAHPFFQPLKGRFGSVTDFSYSQNKFNFDILDGSVLDIDRNSATYGQIINSGLVGISGKQKTTQFAVKEDFSFGITDTLSIIGMLQYDKTKVTLKDWSTGDASNSTSDSGLNLFGIGIQNRFIDNEKWIAMVGASFLHQKDTANSLIGEIKAGYKINRTTLYGLGRAWWTNLTDGDVYGAFVKDDTGDWLMLSYNTATKDLFYLEGGLGVFAVLSQDFTLNGELVYGHYDWHNQLNIKGALGWQPGDSFALNLYASTQLYDSAKNKTKQYMEYDVNPMGGYATSLVYTTGDYKIKDYDEWKIGVQAILYF